MKRFYLIILLFFPFITLAQHQGSVNVMGGSSVTFHVNSLKKWQEGVTLEGWSRVRVRLNNDTSDPTPINGWQFNVKARSTHIAPDGPGTNMDLETLEIRAINVEPLQGTYTGNTPPVTVPLNSDYTMLLSDNQVSNVDLIVTISYDLGTQEWNRLTPYEPGFYFVDLEFQLISTE